MFLATWLTMALAAPCPDLQAEVDAGWNAYEDAELIQAEGHVARAIRSLSCMEASAGKDALLQLYRLNALLSITQSDREGAVYATIRVVTIDPAAEPDPRLGPELADMHETWSARLAQSIIRVAYEGTGGAWIDGQPVGEPWIEVYSGEHVVQFDGPDGWVSRVEELDSSVTLGPPGAKPPPDPEPPRDPNSQFKARRVALLTGVELYSPPVAGCWELAPHSRAGSQRRPTPPLLMGTVPSVTSAMRPLGSWLFVAMPQGCARCTSLPMRLWGSVPASSAPNCSCCLRRI